MDNKSRYRTENVVRDKRILNDQLEKLRKQLRHMERDIDYAMQEEKALKERSLPYADYDKISGNQRNARESIYNRFDNIYVLNLIAASLRNGKRNMLKQCFNY